MRTWFKRAFGAATLAGGLLALGSAAQATESAQACTCDAVGQIASRAGTSTAGASETLSRLTGHAARTSRSSVRPTTSELVRPAPRAVQRLDTKAPAVRATARLGHDAGDRVQANTGVSVDGSVAAGAGLAVKRPSASSAPVAKRHDTTAGLSANLGTSGAGAGVDAEAPLATRGNRLNTSAVANLGATGRDANATANLGITAAADTRTEQLDTTVDAKVNAAKGDDTVAGATTDLSATGDGATAGLGVSAALTRTKQGGTAASAATDLVASEATDTCACGSTSGTGASGTLAAGVAVPELDAARLTTPLSCT